MARNYRSSQPGRSLGASAHEEPCHTWPPNSMHAPIARSPGRPGMSQSESNTAALPVSRPATAVSSPGVSAANQGAGGRGLAATKADAVCADPSYCQTRPSAGLTYCPPNTRLAQHPPSARKAIRSRPNPALRCCHRPQCGKPRTPLRGSRLSSLGAAISLSGLSRGSWQMASASGGASRMKPSRSARGGQGAGMAGR